MINDFQSQLNEKIAARSRKGLRFTNSLSQWTTVFTGEYENSLRRKLISSL